MIGSMGRCKAVAPWTMIYKQPHVHHELGVTTGAKALKPIFKNTAADDICKRYRTNKQDYPPPAFAFEINGDEQKKK